MGVDELNSTVLFKFLVKVKFAPVPACVFASLSTARLALILT